MAYSPSEKYPGAVDVDPDYQGGKFRDNNPSTTNNGSPLKAIDRNELLARDEAIMNDAGFEYNGLPDTPQDSQLFKAYKASLGNGSNLLSNHNFLIQTPDDSQPLPSATPTSYPPGYQIFSGVFANETTGITNLTYIDGLVSFSGGDLYFAVPNTGGVERLTGFVASVADFDGKPRTRGVSFALAGDEYRVTVGVDALEDVSANPTPLGSVKFEQGSVATGHQVYSWNQIDQWRRSGDLRGWFVAGDGVTDDTIRVQSAINYCIANNLQLFVPNGVYLITSALQIDKSLHIKAVEWEGYSSRNQNDPENTRGKGGYFYRNGHTGRLFNITAQASVTFENVAFDENQPLPTSTFTPTNYDWNIFTGSCEDLVLKNVFFRKCTKGVRVDNSNGGAERLRIDGLYGQNLGVMIDIDFQSDVNRLNDIHVWPYWSLSEVVRDYTRGAADVIVSGRNDNPLWSNIFTIAQRYSVRFKNSETSSTGKISNKVHLSNSDFDVGSRGVYVPSGVSGVTMQISNLTCQGHQTEILDSRGIEILGDNCRFDLSNFRSTKTNRQSIRIAGTGNLVRIDNLECEDWGGDGAAAAIAVDSGNTIRIGHNLSFRPNLSNARWSVGPTGKVIAASGDSAQVEKDASVQSIPNAVSTIITWQNIVEDNDNTNINLSGNEITPQVPGLYRVKASVRFESSVDGSFHELRIVAGGVPLGKKVTRSNGVDFFSMDVEKTVRLNGTGQSISIETQQSTGGPVSISSDPDFTFFEVARVG